MDIGLILAATTQEPGLASWLALKTLAWLGVAGGLTFVIFVHELGHFLVAKACGVKCEKFYVGFDFFEFRIPFTNWKIPRSLLKFQWGETEYGIGSLPLGGYVKMLGQDDDPRNAEAEAARIRAAGPSETPPPNEALASSHPAAVSKMDEPPVPAKTTEGDTILLDPRSYPAKPVPARMAIISAGVIMNLIFAVILAAIAYRLGVEEMPAIVGSTSPGGAAWVKGIEPGSKVIQIGKDGKPYEFLRWADIRTTAVLNSDADVQFLLRKPNGEEVWYDVRPTKNADTKLPIIGIGVPYSAEIETFRQPFNDLNASASPPLHDFDRVVEAAGQKITNGTDLNAVFAQQPLGPLAMKVERPERSADGKPLKNPSKPPEIIDVVVQPRPMRELGLSMKIGPVTAIQESSPAGDAGLQVGDVIVEVNGEPVGNPLSLPQRLTPPLGESRSVVLLVERKDRQGQAVKRSVTVVPVPPRQSSTQMAAKATSIESIGVSFEVTSEVAEVAAAGPAANAGLMPGDVVTAAQFVWADEKRGWELSRAAHHNLVEAIDLTPGSRSWSQAIFGLQHLDPDIKVKLTWTRGGKSMSAELTPRDSATFFNDTRGLAQYVDFKEHAAATWSDAFYLGYREAKDQLTQVLTILHRLVTARLSATNLSGPLGIIGVAGSFASQGLAPLLLFLTMLSANLAVLNFLPIPALDGGHMLFLSAEAVRGKPVDERLQVRLTIAGVICLLSLMVFATAMDLQRFVSWFG